MYLPNPFQNLHLLPSSTHLAGAEVELSNTVSRETILKKRLSPISDSYDFIIIDCPPSLSLLTLNAFSFTDHLIIPVQCEYFALEGLAKLLSTVQLIKDRLNPKLNILGIALTMFDRRTSLNRQVVQNAKNHFQDLIFDTIIPRNIRLAEAPSFGLPIALYEPKSSGSIAYYQLTKEVLERANTTQPIRKGLDALIPNVIPNTQLSIEQIPIDEISPNPFQPRQIFDQQALNELALSIQQHGLTQPVLVRQVDNGYELVVGERRLEACKINRAATIPAIIKNISDKESCEIALVENIDRENLTIIEVARSHFKATYR